MKIQSIYVENLYGLESFEARPLGGSIEITGSNAKGKTSVLRAIAGIFGGYDTNAVHVGAASGYARIETETLIAERVTTGVDAGKLTLKTHEGMKVNAPAGVLRSITSKLTFDPIAFASMGKRAQVETLARATDRQMDSGSFFSSFARAASERMMLRAERVAGLMALLADLKLETGLSDYGYDHVDRHVKALGTKVKELSQARATMAAQAEAFRIALDEIERQGIVGENANVVLASAAADALAVAKTFADKVDGYELALGVLKDALPLLWIGESRAMFGSSLEVVGDGLRRGGVAIENLSGAEQIAVSAEVASRLMRTGGLDTLLVDNLERLDPVSTAALVGQMFDYGVQVIGARVVDGAVLTVRPIRVDQIAGVA